NGVTFKDVGAHDYRLKYPSQIGDSEVQPPRRQPLTWSLKPTEWHCQSSRGHCSGVPFLTKYIGFDRVVSKLRSFAGSNFPVGEAMKRFGQWMSWVAVFLAMSSACYPQASSSSLRGTVTDQEGSALPGATIVVASSELQIT